MATGARRLHRLPQRLDYDLIPAPLDLSLTRATEKSPLPAIIVTPSSPSLGSPEYYIAFLTPPLKPSLCERIIHHSPLRGKLPLKARTTLLILLLFFILVFHLFAQLAVHRPPSFEFKSSANTVPHLGSDSHTSLTWNFAPFNLQPFWDSSVNEDRRDYIVEDLSQAAHR